MKQIKFHAYSVAFAQLFHSLLLLDNKNFRPRNETETE